MRKSAKRGKDKRPLGENKTPEQKAGQLLAAAPLLLGRRPDGLLHHEFLAAADVDALRQFTI